MATESLHVVVFPWLAFGHMLPFLELSKSLAKKGHHISFISTPRNIQRLPKLPPQISHLIDFISFNLPQTEGLREGAEATTDLLPEEVPYLKKAFDGLEQPFSEFIRAASPKPDWIIQDFMQYWMPSIGIPCIQYFTTPAAAQVYYGRHWETSSSRPSTIQAFLAPPPWVPFPSKVAYKSHELRKLMEMLALPNPSGVPEVYRCKMATEGCKVLAVRTCQELESEWLGLLGEVLRKPVVPVGLLPPSVDERNYESTVEERNDTAIIMEWLDKQSSRSVVYVALGSEAMMSVEQLRELALGMEVAGLPFIWGLRRPLSLGEEIEMLPQGFKDRTRDLGMVVSGWVPQLKILEHRSVGGFLTHCGWSSIIEGLHSGHPLVLLPIDLDQGLNARLMEEKGMGVEVEKKEDGSFTKEDVSKALRLVMAEDEGEPCRKKAREMMEIVRNKELRDKYVEDFIQYLRSHRSLED